jgi:hypothetical protein
VPYPSIPSAIDFCGGQDRRYRSMSVFGTKQTSMLDAEHVRSWGEADIPNPRFSVRY